jgi:hypothetical protein
MMRASLISQKPSWSGMPLTTRGHQLAEAREHDDGSPARIRFTAGRTDRRSSRASRGR